MIPVAFLQTGLSLHYFGSGIKKNNALEVGGLSDLSDI